MQTLCVWMYRYDHLYLDFMLKCVKEFTLWQLETHRKSTQIRNFSVPSGNQTSDAQPVARHLTRSNLIAGPELLRAAKQTCGESAVLCKGV
jgi:hypothetical protein